MKPLLLAAALLCWAVPATAYSPGCALRAEVLAQLAKEYDEAPVAVGLANNGVLVEILAAPGRVTWTIIVSQPNGMSCLLAAGNDWQELDAPTPPAIGDGL